MGGKRSTQRVAEEDNRLGKQRDQNSMKGYPKGFHQRKAYTSQLREMQTPYKSMQGTGSPDKC